MDVVRTSEGFLFADDFNRADGALGDDWDVLSGTAAISGNQAVCSANNTNVRDVAAAEQNEVVVQAKVTIAGGTAGGLLARVTAAGHAYYFQLQEGARVHLFHRNPGYTSVNQLCLFTYTPGSPAQCKVHVADGLQRGWFGATGAATGQLAHAGMDETPGTGGFHRNSSCTVDDYARYKNNTIVCENLPTGHKLRVGTRVATESGGTATVDLLQDLCPRAKVEILDAGDNVVAELTPEASETSPAGVWGGDTYTISVAGEVPSTPGAFTAEPGEILDSLPFLFEWGESTDPNVPPVGFTYRLERSSDGGQSWVLQGSEFEDAEYLLQPSGLASGTYRLRVRADNEFGSTPYVESSDFVVAHTALPTSRKRGVFLGESGGNGLYRADEGIDDGGTVFRPLLRTAPIAPAGFGGEIVLYGASFKVRYAGSAFFRITPIINGVRKPPHFVQYSGGGAYTERTVEISFLETVAGARSGLRCQWFRLGIEMSPLDPHAVLYGFAAEIDRVREGMPDATPSPEEMQEFLMPARRGIFAGGEGDLVKLDEGTTDLGQEYALRVGTHDYMPAGPGGEAIFPYLYLPIVHANAAAFDLELVVAIEGVALEPITVTVPAADGLIVNVLEVPLYQTHMLGGFATRHAARGERIRIMSLRNADPLATVRWALQGWEPEFEPVRRTELLATAVGGHDLFQPGGGEFGGGSTIDNDWPGIETPPPAGNPFGEETFDDGGSGETLYEWFPPNPDEADGDYEFELVSPWQPGTCEGGSQTIEFGMKYYSPNWLVNDANPDGPSFDLVFGIQTEDGSEGSGGIPGGTAFAGDFEVIANACFSTGVVTCAGGGSSGFNQPGSGLPTNQGPKLRFAFYSWTIPCNVAYRVFIRFEQASSGTGQTDHGFDVERFNRTVS